MVVKVYLVEGGVEGNVSFEVTVIPLEDRHVRRGSPCHALHGPHVTSFNKLYIQILGDTALRRFDTVAQAQGEFPPAAGSIAGREGSGSAGIERILEGLLLIQCT